ncbi:hypothetical protein [Pseudogracilibacillus sp. SO10305]|uniref:hypothetical protein n=1 Tax=Pseudogracilibacillus sp. SO10305 TaxID=3098292 RepID=UPI00300E5465
MSYCPIDHTLDDVQRKLEEQKAFLRDDLYKKSVIFLQQKQSQLVLNELFHLLKKYDLVTETERKVRHQGFEQLLK